MRYSIWLSWFGSLWLIIPTLTTAAAWSPTSDQSWPMFHGNYNHTGYANVVGPAEATLQWKIKAASGEDNAPPPNSIAIDSKGIIYLGSPEKIYALKPNGHVKWSKAYTSVQGPALSADGKTLYFNAENSIVAVSTKTGKREWKYNTDGSMLFGPTVGPDGVIYQGSWDGYVYAIKPTGKLKWKYLTAGAISYPPSIDKSGIIYVGGGDAHAGPDSYLYALKPNGNLKWKYDTTMTRVGSPAIGSDELIYVPAAPTLIVVNKAGELQWSAGPDTGGGDEDGSDDENPDDGGGNEPPGGDDGEQTIMATDDVAGIISPAIGKDGTIYLGNSQGVVLALDPDSHETLWTYQTGASSDDATLYGLPSFPVVDKRGRVYIGAVDGKIYAFSKIGDLLWTYQTDDGIAEAAAALGPDGTLYISSDDGYLYAIND